MAEQASHMNIPFDFTVGKTTLPASEYVVRAGSPAVLFVQNKETYEAAILSFPAVRIPTSRRCAPRCPPRPIPRQRGSGSLPRHPAHAPYGCAGSPGVFLRSDDNQCLALGLTSPNALFHSPQIRFVDFHRTLQLLPPGPHHGPAQLVQPGPGCLVAAIIPGSPPNC